jgi:hypothetical protein
MFGFVFLSQVWFFGLWIGYWLDLGLAQRGLENGRSNFF